MKRTVSFIFLILFALYSHAGEGEQVLFKAHYIATLKKYDDEKNHKTEEMILEVGRQQSKFYSRFKAERQHIIDSLNAIGASTNEVLSAIGKIPTPKSSYYVWRNIPKKDTLIFADHIFKRFYYEEPIERQAWKVIDKDSIILGYNCQKAVCKWRGRTWEAWFTSQIPSDAGPWKLCGLPGLIVFASDESGTFAFEMIELKKGNGEKITLPDLNKYIKCTREEFMKEVKEAANDPIAYEKRYGLPGKAWGPDGKPLKYKARTPVFLDK